MNNNKISILAIPGSLRADASSMAVIRTAAGMMPDNADFHIYEKLGDIPPFDDSANLPLHVKNFRTLIDEADGILICQPEYAFGVAGILKNALDWTVASGEFNDMPVALITAATGGEKAHASMLLTLTALSARVIEGGTLQLPFIRSKIDENNEITDLATLQSIRGVVDALIKCVVTA